MRRPDTRHRFARVVACALASVTGALPAQTQAQSLESGFLGSEIPWDASRGENVSVLERPRPEYEAVGIQAGSFTLYPRTSIGLGFSNNVYAQRHDAVADGYGSFDPSLTLRSDWTRNSLSLSATGAFRRFFDETPRDENGFKVNGSGRLDLGDDRLAAQAGITRGYSPQYFGDYPINARESFEYTLKTALLRDTWEGARFRLIGSADTNRLTFNNPQTLDGGRLDGSSLDRTVDRASGRVEYGANPDAAAFVQVTYINTDYDSHDALGAQGSRSSHEVRELAGATFDLRGLFRGAVGLGYTSRNYADPRYGHIAGVAADVRLQYFVTPLTTATLEVSRSVEDAISTDSGGYFATTTNLRVDHELLRNLLLNLGGGYQVASFKGISRHDRVYSAVGGANYLLSRELGLNFTLSYLKRNSDGVGGITFGEAEGKLGLTFQL